MRRPRKPKPPLPPTDNQRRVWEYMRARQAEGERPSYWEIATAMGYNSPGSSRHVILALVKKGYVREDIENYYRRWEALPEPENAPREEPKKQDPIDTITDSINGLD